MSNAKADLDDLIKRIANLRNIGQMDGTHAGAIDAVLSQARLVRSDMDASDKPAPASISAASVSSVSGVTVPAHDTPVRDTPVHVAPVNPLNPPAPVQG